jgi:hypothetical protein
MKKDSYPKPRTIIFVVFKKSLPVAVPLLVFFVFNMLTPVWLDDFVMSCVYNGWYQPSERLLSSFSDIISSTYDMYHSWHGRSPVDFINYLFMYLGDKTIFNICNTIVYGIFIFLICYHITGSIKKIQTWFFLFINILLWVCIPAWGQSLLWLTGSCNYLWTSAVILFFLIPFRKKVDDSSFSLNTVSSVLFFFVGILAGWSMENSAAGVCVLLIIYFIVKIVRKEKFSLFEIVGALGFFIGFYMLVRVRYNGAVDLKLLTSRLFNATSAFFKYGGIIATLLILLGIEIIHFRKKKLNYFICTYFLAALAGTYTMIFYTFIPGRSFFMPCVFLVITLLYLIQQISAKIERRYIIGAIIIVTIPLFIPSFISGTNSIVKSYLLSTAREHYILSEKKKGILAVQVKTPVPVEDSHSGLHDGIDVLSITERETKEYVQNSSKAVYYGIHSLDGITVEEDREGKKGLKDIFADYWKRRKSDHLTKDDLFLMIYNNW